MAPLLSDIVHGLHVDLASRHHGLRSFTDMLEDPWYTCEVFQANRSRDLSTALFDVREYPGAFFLEGEFPGIKEKSAINIEWVGKRTLVVESMPTKMDIAADWGVEVVEAAMVPSGTANSRASTRTAEEDSGAHRSGGSEAKPVWKDRLRERQRVSLQRSFSFPKAVNPDQLRVKLDSGVLKIMVPKEPEEAQVVTKVEIED
jgi:HSP20 family molecular chaperone IbpA